MLKYYHIHFGKSIKKSPEIPFYNYEVLESLKNFEKGIDNVSILDYYLNIQNGYQ